MNKTERSEFLKSQKSYDMFEIQVLKWMRYWITAGLDGIEDETLRQKTSDVMKMILKAKDTVVRRVRDIGIMSEVLDTVEETPSYADIETIVSATMANHIDWVLLDGLPY